MASAAATAAAGGGRGAGASAGDPAITVAPVSSSSSSTFDVESYLSNYTGHTRIDRALFIGDLSLAHRIEAYTLALKDLRDHTMDTKHYLAVAAKLNDALAAAGQPAVPGSARPAVDTAWAAQVDRDMSLRGEKLEQELKLYKSNQIKESVRMGHNDLADFYYKQGDLQNALKNYQRTRDYCTTSKHIVQMCLNVIRVALELEQFVHVNSFVAKASITPDIAKDTLAMSKLNAALGLYHLHDGQFKAAADCFAKVSFELNNTFNDVIAAPDIGLYGGLCALASYNRRELQDLSELAQVTTNADFRQYVDLVPKVRLLIDNLVKARYADVLALLQQSKADWLLDVYLRKHVDELQERIRKRSLIQYAAPYQTVNLHQMALAFSMPLAELEATLVELIQNRDIKARIDALRKALHTRQADINAQTLEHALQSGQDFQRQTKAALLRMNMLRANFVVQREDPTSSGSATALTADNAMAVDLDRPM